MASRLIVARRWLLLSSHHCRGKLIRQDINFPNLSDRRLSCFCRHSDELKLIEFCSFSADKKCVIIIQILWFALKSLFLLCSLLKKKILSFFLFIHPNFVPYSGALHETCVHSHSRLIPVWMKMWWGRYAGMAWLGLAGMPYLYIFQPPPPPGSCGGSDKDGFPDQDQSDSWVPEEDGWIWDWDGPRVPQGPSGLITYVQWNDTNDLIG